MSKTMGSNRPSAWSKMELKRRVFVFSEEESSMEEEWMRDRALLRDLLNKDPQTPPQELARAIGRSVSWVKKWRKRLREGDRKSTRLNSSHDQISYAVFCLKKEEHTSELQSRSDLVCRLLLEKKN